MQRTRKANIVPRVRRTTLKDVANMAGVSVSTASLVLAGKSADRRISREVEERVREIAHQQDYNPNLLVKSMQRGQTHVLAFYSAFRRRERNDLYMDRLLTAIMREAGDSNYDVLTYCDFSRDPEDFYRHINGGLADGLLFFGPVEIDPLLPLLREARLPIVLLLHEDTEDRLCCVVEDVENGIEQIATRLVDAGHRLVAGTLSPPGEITDSQLRITLLQDALRRKGADMPDELICPISEESDDALDALLERLLKSAFRPSALFCWHDRIGYRLLEACDRLGVSVPDDLSLIGYDGLHWPSTSSHILTSVAVDIDAAATAAVELLTTQIDGETLSTRRYRLPVRWEPGTTFGSVSAL